MKNIESSFHHNYKDKEELEEIQEKNELRIREKIIQKIKKN